jgi:hypothetical protein
VASDRAVHPGGRDVCTCSYPPTHIQCDAPDASRIPREDLLGVTAVLITCAYMGVEFVRVGYYVNVDFTDESMKENPPATVQPEALTRKYVRRARACDPLP